MADIGAIEMRRKALNIPKGELCRVADIDRGTYRRMLIIPGSGRADTLTKLGKALDVLAEARRHG